jgi:ribosomal protein S27AE
MKTVYTAADPIMAGFIEGVLQNAGIQAHVLQAGLYGAAGAIPPNECWARVVVVHPEQAEQALAVIKEYLEAEADPSVLAWKCPRCGEQIEAQFTQCWSCGHEREAPKRW